jgi:hypothetical protein
VLKVHKHLRFGSEEHSQTDRQKPHKSFVKAELGRAFHLEELATLNELWAGGNEDAEVSVSCAIPNSAGPFGPKQRQTRFFSSFSSAAVWRERR